MKFLSRFSYYLTQTVTVLFIKNCHVNYVYRNISGSRDAFWRGKNNDTYWNVTDS